jgi:hypothetical protein
MFIIYLLPLKYDAKSDSKLPMYCQEYREVGAFNKNWILLQRRATKRCMGKVKCTIIYVLLYITL